jgi:hypothetical protein
VLTLSANELWYLALSLERLKGCYLIDVKAKQVYQARFRCRRKERSGEEEERTRTAIITFKVNFTIDLFRLYFS